MLYLYAVVGAAPREPLGAGLRGEAIRIVECAGVLAAAGEMAAPPVLGAEALRGHDAVVRRIAALADAVLPARFGSVVEDAGALCAFLEPAAVVMQEALARVAGRAQMILRVFADAPVAVPAVVEPEPSVLGPGARYLAQRARVARAASELPELAPIRPVLDRLVVAEHVERSDRLPLVASVYHLVARGDAAAYARDVDAAAARLAPVRVTVTGPWAPYAFVPEALA